MVCLAGIEPASTRLKRPPLNRSATGTHWCGRKESNPLLGVRSAVFYSLNYAHLSIPGWTRTSVLEIRTLARFRCATGMKSKWRRQGESNSRPRIDNPLICH